MAKSGGTFAESSQQCNEILATMRGGGYAPLYLLNGTEGYFIDKIEEFVLSNALPDSERDFNQVVIYGKDSSASEVIMAARRYPMMAQRQVIVVREAQNLKGFEELAHYVAQPLDSTVLVISHREKSVDKRSSFYKKCVAAKGAIIFESNSPRDWEVASFVITLFNERGLKPDNGVVQMIADNIGANCSRIACEIDKLKTRLAQGTVNITQKDVQDNIGISKDFNNFELCKALSVGDFARALFIADYFGTNEKDNPLVVTINQLFSHFQRIVTLGFLIYDSHRRAVPMPSDAEVAKLLKLPFASFLAEYKTAVNIYPLPKAVNILGLIRTWDMKSKGMLAGSSSKGELLRELIIRISMS